MSAASEELKGFAERLVGVDPELKAEIVALAERLSPDGGSKQQLGVVNRRQFESMPPAERMNYVRRGGKIHDR